MASSDIELRLTLDTSDAEDALRRLSATARSLHRRTRRQRATYIVERLTLVFGSAALAAWLMMLFWGALHSVAHSQPTASYTGTFWPCLVGAVVHEVVRNSKRS